MDARIIFEVCLILACALQIANARAMNKRMNEMERVNCELRKALGIATAVINDLNKKE